MRLAFRGLHYNGCGELLENSFYYTLTKFMITYYNEELLRALYCVCDYNSLADFVRLLRYNFICIIKEIKDIKRKERELIAYQNILDVLDNSNIEELPEKEYDFQYAINFDGLCKLLEEKNIDKKFVNIVIDEEQKTYCAAQNYNFCDMRSGKSDEIIELRLSDWIASFIGRMVYALSHDKGMKEDKVTNIRKIGENDLERKRILNEEWFLINEKQFDLYHLIYNALIIGHTDYWTAMTMSYGDECSIFFTLVRYFSKYENYQNYKDIEPKLHSEYFNTSCISELERSYKNFFERK